MLHSCAVFNLALASTIPGNLKWTCSSFTLWGWSIMDFQLVEMRFPTCPISIQNWKQKQYTLSALFSTTDNKFDVKQYMKHFSGLEKGSQFVGKLFRGVKTKADCIRTLTGWLSSKMTDETVTINVKWWLRGGTDVLALHTQESSNCYYLSWLLLFKNKVWGINKMVMVITPSEFF